MKNEMIKKIESAKYYLKMWNTYTDDQITKNHIASIFNTLCNIENLANGLSTCDGQLTQPAVIKSLPKNVVFGDHCIGCKLFEHYKEVYNIPF